MSEEVQGPTEEVADTLPVEEEAAPILSQRDYVPTPYRDSQWEVVGDVKHEVGFFPLEVNIVESDMPETDPMFEDFDAKEDKLSGTTFHGPEGGLPQEAAEVAFDPSVIEAELEAKYQEGFQAGKAEGIKEGEAKEHERLEDVNSRFVELSKQLTEQHQSMLQRIERESLALTIEISKKILQLTTEAKPEYILDVIRTGLQSLGASQPVKVRVSPQDMEFLEVVGTPPELSAEELGLEYVSDETISSGCIIETDFGEVDLELDSMWEQVKASLMEVQR